VGGGISRAFDLFSPMIIEELKQRVFVISRDCIRLIRAQLGNDAGVLGAGFLALDVLQRFENDTHI
jgi:glucokinase